jgi:PAS domain-containing protein
VFRFEHGSGAWRAMLATMKSRTPSGAEPSVASATAFDLTGMATTIAESARTDEASVAPSASTDVSAAGLAEAGTVKDPGGLEATPLGAGPVLFLSLDMMCIADAGGRFIRVHPAWQDTLRSSVADLTAVPFLRFVHADDILATAAEASKLAVGGTTINFENRYRCKDDSCRWSNWKATGFGGVDLRHCSRRHRRFTAFMEAVRQLGAFWAVVSETPLVVVAGAT